MVKLGGLCVYQYKCNHTCMAVMCRGASVTFEWDATLDF